MFKRKVGHLLVIMLVISLYSPMFSTEGDNENQPPRHSHTRDISGLCICLPGPILSFGGGCITIGYSGIGFWAAIETCWHGIDEPECPANCGFDVDSNKEHLDYCTSCGSAYYICVEVHNAVQCGGSYN